MEVVNVDITKSLSSWLSLAGGHYCHIQKNDLQVCLEFRAKNRFQLFSPPLEVIQGELVVLSNLKESYSGW